MLHALNYFFIATHVVIISFTLTGWVFPRLRKLHLFLILLTLFSWLVLGYWFGWGYCFWTDWHWQVRRQLHLSSPGSFVKLLADWITGMDLNPNLVDKTTEITLYVVSGLSFLTNFLDYRKKQARRSAM